MSSVYSYSNTFGGDYILEHYKNIAIIMDFICVCDNSASHLKSCTTLYTNKLQKKACIIKVFMVSYILLIYV